MCAGPDWKREVVPDHKFDFVDTREFTDNGFGMRMKYLWLYIIVLKSFLVYVSDIFSATTMLTTNGWSNQIFNNCQHLNGCFFIPFNIGKWLFVGCIIFSFLLLAYESRKSKKIIASRDISYAFTNVMANHYYSLRSYDHFCFFDHISNSTKKKDDFAFFVFFTFKSWKVVLLADAPRQTINALTLYSIYLSKKDQGDWWDVPHYFNNNNLSTSVLTVTTSLTVVVFAGSALLLVLAGIFYIPLLCYIQGNLKEYVCHKVDKRIAEIIKRRNKARQIEAAKHDRKEAMGDYSHLRNKKGVLVTKPLPQPTLPQLSVHDDDYDDSSSMRTRGPPPSTSGYNSDYYGDSKSMAPSYAEFNEYPPMPAYNHSAYGHGGYGHSQATLAQPEYYEEEDNMHLASAAAPIARDERYLNPHGSMGLAGAYVADAHEVYQGRAQPPPTGQYLPPPSNVFQGPQDYPSPTSNGPPSATHYELDDAYGGYSTSAHQSAQAAPQQQQQQQQQYQSHHQQRSSGGSGGHYTGGRAM